MEVPWLFALVFSCHLSIVADIPPEYSTAILVSSAKEEIDPYDMAAVLISEHSGRDYNFSLLGYPDEDWLHAWEPAEVSVGLGGELGLFQLGKYWRRKTGLSDEDAGDPILNIFAAAAAIRGMQESHEGCAGDHTWVAHYKTSPGYRDVVCGQIGWSKRKWKRLRASLTRLTKPWAMAKEHARRYRKHCVPSV